MQADNLSLLGNKSEIPDNPEAAVLETFPNPYDQNVYNIRFTIPEFTSLCPKTGQPDFAHIVIDYVPNKLCIESKALKLFMFSFRNHGSFHESCTMKIATRLVQATKPRWLRIAAYWYPRGGIPLDIFWQCWEPLEGVFVPALDVPMYRGRG